MVETIGDGLKEKVKWHPLDNQLIQQKTVRSMQLRRCKDYNANSKKLLRYLT